MTDKPILFSAPMVRALLEGRKTQTRRVIHLYPSIDGRRFPVFPPEEIIELEPGEFSSGTCHYASTGALSGPYRLPYSVGDMLWVRESGFQLGNAVDAGKEKDGYEICGFRYSADTATRYLPGMFEGHDYERRRNSIHMPRWASRLTLEVINVRVQRLQEITTDDAVDEGIERSWARGTSSLELMAQKIAKNAFRDLWDSINAARGFGWDSNPWVVALTFRVHPMNIDNLLKRRETA